MKVMPYLQACCTSKLKKVGIFGAIFRGIILPPGIANFSKNVAHISVFGIQNITYPHIIILKTLLRLGYVRIIFLVVHGDTGIV